MFSKNLIPKIDRKMQTFRLVCDAFASILSFFLHPSTLFAVVSKTLNGAFSTRSSVEIGPDHLATL